MTHPAPSLHAADQRAHDRHTRVLDAAQACFSRAGFNRTTMQEVAKEAGMSPGNLYRYFPSKDALVTGLAERDRNEVLRDMADLSAAQDFMSAFARLGRKHLEDDPVDKAVLCLEIWAESTRNATVAAANLEFERHFRSNLEAQFRAAQAAGALSPDIDAEALALLVLTLSQGLLVRRAIAEHFDPRREVQQALCVVGAAMKGAIPLVPATAPVGT